MINREITISDIGLITKESFKQAIYLAYRDSITSIAPLGYSGDTIILFGTPGGGRISQVSVRNYSGDAELLVTDAKGNFLFYGRYDINMGVEFVCEQYWNIFMLLKDKIETILPQVSSFSEMNINPKVSISEAFEMMRVYQEATSMLKRDCLIPSDSHKK